MTKKFTKTEFFAMLDDLDSLLGKHQVKLKAICCGGFVMQVRYDSPRQTGDIDMVSFLPEEIQHLVLQVGRARISDEHEFDQLDWLNDTTAVFNLGEKLPGGWRQRALDEDPLLDLPNVKLFPLSRDDMIFTKLYAVAFGRSDLSKARSDDDDLRQLGLADADIDRHEKAIVALFPFFKGIVAKWRLRSKKKE